jgi:hypothetical protein
VTTKPHPAAGHAITQFIMMRDKANEIATAYFNEHGGAAIGELVHDETTGLHYMEATGLIGGDIEIAKTRVWEDGRVEKIHGS